MDLVAELLVTMGTTWAEVRHDGSERLRSFGLNADIWHVYPTTFSGGDQQKVNLVHALIAPGAAQSAVRRNDRRVSPSRGCTWYY